MVSRQCHMLPMTPILPISSPGAAKELGLRLEDMGMMGKMRIMISRQRCRIPLLPMTPILPIALPGATKEPGLRPCGWEANDEGGVGEEEAG